MSSPKIVYDPACDWYVRYETYLKDGEMYKRKRAMFYYYGKTNIPKVKRDKK